MPTPNVSPAAFGVPSKGPGNLTVQDPDGSHSTAASKIILPAGKVVTSGATATLYDNPIRSIIGTPDTAYDFDSSSLAGLTAIGSPTTENADTTIPGHLYYKDSTSTTAWMGRYQASPATPFTAIIKVSDSTASQNYNSAALIIGVADPTTGAFVTNESANNNGRKILAEKFTNRTTFSGQVGSDGYSAQGFPVFLACVVNSTTSIDYYFSLGGYVWRQYVAANNPSLTVGSVGVAMKSENGSGHTVAFDFFYIYNSAKTFPFST